MNNVARKFTIAEASLVEVRGINRRTGERAAATTEIRVGGQTIASWREVALADLSGAKP